MFCLENIILIEKRSINDLFISCVFEHFEILSESKSHSHLKSTIIQIAYLLKDQPGINEVYLKHKLFYHLSNALNYSLEKPLESESMSQSKLIIMFSQSNKNWIHSHISFSSIKLNKWSYWTCSTKSYEKKNPRADTNW